MGQREKVDEETYLSPRDTQETHRHKHPSNRNLIIAELDPVEILHAKTVRRNETVQRENLVHLNCRDQRCAALSDDVYNWRQNRQGGRQSARDRVETCY